MRIIGMILTLSGLIWGIIAFKMPTTVKIDDKYFELLTDSPSPEIHNLALSNKRNTHLQASAVLAVIGSLFWGFGSIQRSSSLPSIGTKECPFCVELVKVEAKFCKHCGKEIPEAKPKSEPKEMYSGDLDSLHYAAWSGNWERVNGLLREGADVNQTNKKGKTALDLARMRNDQQVIDLLISKGATG
ncbi:ankyrin repeat domain-containing protein [Shewanella sp. MBTL60-007]|uniref:ankyrin repeat domain-containing protein n=1 Tax=Shewanella sp. MBTL60-007 TaxID=2815911 RepID=UPI001BC6D685|nr:ankyrin repeat domain-containing protein [Shewanella sp. MBTL60-007]GIU32548.1 hypothetical protein TUM3792_45120 [Shewanella sp. MBTL60-007]